MSRTANPLLFWAPAILLSLFVHATMVVAIQIGTQPDPVHRTEDIRTRIDVSSLDVPSQRAEAREAEGEIAEASETSGERLGVREVPTSRAAPVAPSGQVVAALAPDMPASRPVAAEGVTLAAAASPGAQLDAAGLDAAKLTPATAPVAITAAIATPSQAMTATGAPAQAVALSRPDSTDLAPVAAAAAALPTMTAVGEAVSSSTPSATPAVARPADSVLLVASAANIPSVSAQRPQAVRMGAVAAPTQTLAGGRAAGQRLASTRPPPAPIATLDTGSPGVASAAALATPQSTELAPSSTADAAVVATAALAWSGAANTALDEQSLAAIQSFMRPGEVAGSAAFAGSVRDGIAGALSQFPCSRLQAAFQPDSGGLEIRGHIPSEEFRPAIVGMLQNTVGDSIPVGDNVLILPSPQCGVLDAVDRLGVPQSVDQIDDPLVIGEEAQARIVQYEDGQLLTLALKGADYDAHIYMDYYDADGNVIHIQPNEYVPETFRLAEEPFVIGGPDSGLELTISAPFGQDIVIVLAATDPLYDGVRPLVERADDYLPWLHARVEDFRAADPDFRGEWAYLFVMTGPLGAFANR